MVRLVGVEAAGRAARAEVRWRSGRRREVRVAQRVEDGLEVWAVGGGVRCALERWPQADWLAEATPEDAEALDAHAVLARLRALLVDASGARDAWRDVLHCANVSRRYGVSEVAADVIEGHAPRWPPPWDAPPCACGAWRVWLAHHMPREGWQARRMIEAMGDPELRGLCPARWALLPVGRDGRPNGPARLLGCASWLGRGGPGRGVQLWSERVHDTPSPPAGARWRYAWSEHKARLERVAGEAGDALTVHGVEVSRVTLAPDLRLGLGDAAVRVVPAHRCLVVSLEHGDLGGVRTYTYTQDRVVFGASPDSDVVFSEATVRPTHAEARWRAGRWELHADATAPPLKINGKRVRRRALRATDVLRLGAWSITFPGVG